MDYKEIYKSMIMDVVNDSSRPVLEKLLVDRVYFEVKVRAEDEKDSEAQFFAVIDELIAEGFMEVFSERPRMYKKLQP